MAEAPVEQVRFNVKSGPHMLAAGVIYWVHHHLHMLILQTIKVLWNLHSSGKVLVNGIVLPDAVIHQTEVPYYQIG